jgi:hypothetical protein
VASKVCENDSRQKRGASPKKGKAMRRRATDDGIWGDTARELSEGLRYEAECKEEELEAEIIADCPNAV